MYENFYGLAEKPFSLLPDPEFLYLGEQHGMALAMLQYGLVNQAGFTVITGEIGCGKTTLIRQLLNEMGEDIVVGLLSNTHRAFGDLLEQILMAFRVRPQDTTKAERYQVFVDLLVQHYGAGQRTVLIVDEAQNLDVDTLEELRLLSNVNADKDQILQLILVGQPELWDKLSRPDLVQFAQRISVDYSLEPLSGQELAAYIQHRLVVAGGAPDIFSPEAITLIHQASSGVPRLVNTLCDTAMVYGYAKQSRHIDGALMDRVIRDRARSGLFRCGIPGAQGDGVPEEGTPAERELEKGMAPEPGAAPAGGPSRHGAASFADHKAPPSHPPRSEETALDDARSRIHRLTDTLGTRDPQGVNTPGGGVQPATRFRSGPGKA